MKNYMRLTKSIRYFKLFKILEKSYGWEIKKALWIYWRGDQRVAREWDSVLRKHLLCHEKDQTQWKAQENHW